MRQPGSDRSVGPEHGEVGPGQMEMGERVAERVAMLDIGPPHPQAFEERDERSGPSGEFLERAARAVLDRQRAGDAARDEMLHQREEIRQVLAPHPLLVKRENVASALGVDEIVRVLDALGDAL